MSPSHDNPHTGQMVLPVYHNETGGNMGYINLTLTVFQSI